MNEKIVSLVNELVQLVKNRIDEAKKKNEVQTREISINHFRWELKDFVYDLKKGVLSSGASGIYTTSNEPVYLHEIDEKIKEVKEYRALRDNLLKEVSIENLDYKLNSLIKKIDREYLRNNFDEKNTIENFSKELGGESLKLRSKVELVGLTLESEEITISPNIKIRRTKREDIEQGRTLPDYSGWQYNFPRYPSAIMEIEMLGKNAVDIQNEIEKIITILRLFGVGGIKYLAYTLSSDFIGIPIGGIISSVERTNISSFYPVYDRDIARLKKFFNELYNFLPSNINDGNLVQKVNLNFSYQRYSESLLSNDFMERKITNAISGLESIYLSGQGELIRYLKLSIGKVMSIFGQDPYKIMDIIDDGYRVRSDFIHGNKMNHKTKRKLEQKYGSMDFLLESILNYLRISILILFLMNKEKEEFIDFIEDSFIDKNKELSLSQQITGIKDRLGEI